MPAATIHYPSHSNSSQKSQQLSGHKSAEICNNYILPLHLRNVSLGLGIVMLILGTISLFTGALVYIFTIGLRSILLKTAASIWMGIFVSLIVITMRKNCTDISCLINSFTFKICKICQYICSQFTA